jgi:hypothetical protein
MDEIIGAIETLEIGDPLNPFDPSDATLAGTAASGAGSHPGNLVNIRGAWAEANITALDTATTFYHNMDLDVFNAAEPNVCWTVKRWQHDNATRTLWDALDVSTPQLGTVAANRPTRGALGVAPFNTLELFWFKDDIVASEDEVQYTVMLPGGWKVGTDIIPMVHWTPSADPGAADRCVRWGMEYSWADVGDAYPAITTIYTDATDDSTQTMQGTQLVAGTHYTSMFAALDSTGLLPYSVLVFKLFRNSSHALDDYVGSAGLIDFTIHYQADGVGSDEMITKTSDLELEWSTFNIRYQTNDTVAANSIDLRCYAAPWLEVSAQNPLKVTLFFTPAVR